MFKFEISKHVSQTRLERLTAIATTIGFGTRFVCKCYAEDRFQCLTDTGVILILDRTETKLITGYMATDAKAYAIMRSTNTENYQAMMKIVKENMRKYPHILKICA